MTSVFYGIAAAFNALFSILPFILKWVDLFFVIIGAILIFGWIRYMIQHQDEEKGYNQPVENEQQ